MTPELIRQRMNAVNRKVVAGSTAGVLNGLQSWPAHVQLIATCMVFWRLCRIMQMTPSDVFAVCNNLFTDGIKPAPEFRAVDSYINTIIKREEIR